jgi:hypothetical protein
MLREKLSYLQQANQEALFLKDSFTIKNGHH